MSDVFHRAHRRDVGLVLLDGLPGSGKSLLGPLLSTLGGLERQRISEPLEAIVGLHALSRLSDDVAQELITMLLLSHDVNTRVSREVNLRPSDDTGLLRNPYALRTLGRLLARSDSSWLAAQHSGTPVYATHALVANPRLLDLVEGTTAVVLTRRPLETLVHHATYLSRINRDRDFAIQLENAAAAPVGWQLGDADPQLLGRLRTPVDVAALTIAHVSAKVRAHAAQDGVVVTFDDIAYRTQDAIASLADRIGHPVTSMTARWIRRLGLPRREWRFSGGGGRRSYGWRPDLSDDDALGLLDRVDAAVGSAFEREDQLWQDAYRS